MLKLDFSLACRWPHHGRFAIIVRAPRTKQLGDTNRVYLLIELPLNCQSTAKICSYHLKSRNCATLTTTLNFCQVKRFKEGSCRKAILLYRYIPRKNCDFFLLPQQYPTNLGATHIANVVEHKFWLTRLAVNAFFHTVLTLQLDIAAILICRKFLLWLFRVHRQWI